MGWNDPYNLGNSEEWKREHERRLREYMQRREEQLKGIPGRSIKPQTPASEGPATYSTLDELVGPETF